MKWILVFTLLFASFTSVYGQDTTDIPKYLQDISITIKAGGAQGSGVMITREIKKNKDSTEKVKVNFVWTAGHVIDGLRSTREVVDPKSGQKKTAIQFKDAVIVKELIEDGRKVGETSFDAKVIKYSDSENGEDLALLMIRKTSFVDVSAKFYLKEEILPIGTELYHVGSLLGQVGANSLTTGIISQTGRVLDLGNGAGRIFDQTTVPAFPGSSGGGVFIKNGEHQGEYMGMLVRGAGETFNLIVPVRRIREWATKSNVCWALDPSIEAPSLLEIQDLPAEEMDVKFIEKAKEATVPGTPVEFPFLIKQEYDEGAC